MILVKLGGSVITDKAGRQAADLATINLLAEEILAARSVQPDLELVLGHGSGSFGHPAAQRYGVHRGLADDADWIGFAETSAAALRLNRIVVDQLLAVGVPALSLQPSASLQSRNGRVIDWTLEPLELALQRRLVPVIHGDVAFDTQQGSAIASTEELFRYLVLHGGGQLRPQRIVLVGEAAVYTADPRRDPQAQPIPLITAANLSLVLGGAGASHGIDVTGGMRSKIELMWELVQAVPGLQVQLIGPFAGLLRRALLGQAFGEGTTIRLQD